MGPDFLLGRWYCQGAYLPAADVLSEKRFVWKLKAAACLHDAGHTEGSRSLTYHVGHIRIVCSESRGFLLHSDPSASRVLTPFHAHPSEVSSNQRCDQAPANRRIFGRSSSAFFRVPSCLCCTILSGEQQASPTCHCKVALPIMKCYRDIKYTV